MTKKEEEIQRSMKSLSISRAEAEELYAYDHGADNEEADKLTKKAKDNKVKMYVRSEKAIKKSMNKSKKSKPKPPNQTKIDLIEKLHNLLDFPHEVQNKECEIVFPYGDKIYSLKLIEHTKKWKGAYNGQTTENAKVN